MAPSHTQHRSLVVAVVISLLAASPSAAADTPVVSGSLVLAAPCSIFDLDVGEAQLDVSTPDAVRTSQSAALDLLESGRPGYGSPASDVLAIGDRRLRSALDSRDIVYGFNIGVWDHDTGMVELAGFSARPYVDSESSLIGIRFGKRF